MFKLEIGMTNAAFEDEPVTELARILRALADRLESGEADMSGAPVRDINGNRVGHYTFTNK